MNTDLLPPQPQAERLQAAALRGFAAAASDGAAFDVWWHDEGSGMPPLPGKDAETHVKRVCKIAWLNGAYKAQEQTK